MLYEPWMDSAACAGYDPEAFFIRVSSKTLLTDLNRLETAKSICEICPVKDACRQYAEKHNVQGLFGGVYVKPVS